MFTVLNVPDLPTNANVAGGRFTRKLTAIEVRRNNLNIDTLLRVTIVLAMSRKIDRPLFLEANA